VKTHDSIQENFEKRKQEYVLEFIRKKDLISSDGNIIFSQKAFVINSVLRWCLDAVSNKKMSQTKWTKFNRILGQYIAGIVDIKWKNGTLEIIEIPNDNEKRRKPSPRTK
jgi:hypothetical protein